MKILIYGKVPFVPGLADALSKEKVECYLLGENFNLRDREGVLQFLKKSGCRVVVNCGAITGGIDFVARNGADVYSQNLYSALNLYEVCAKLGSIKLINLLSNSSYGSVVKGNLLEKNWLRGILDKSTIAVGFAARALWACSKVYDDQYKLKSTNLIVSNVYGPGEFFDESRSYALGAIIAKIHRAIEGGEKQVILWGSGKPVRDWLYTDDLAMAILASLKKGSMVGPVNIGSGQGVSISTLAQLIAKIMNYKGRIYFDKTKTDGVLRKVMDIKIGQEYLNWRPKTPLVVGLSRTIDWYLENVKLK